MIDKTVNPFNWVFAFILAYITLRAPYFFANVFIPDETWHMGYMEANKGWRLFTHKNYEAHGAGYWAFGSLIFTIFDKFGYFAMRGLSILSLAGSAYFIYKIGRYFDNKNINFIVLAWLTAPVLWFGGKLVLPETYTLFLLSLSAYLILTSKENDNFVRRILAWVIMGFCIAMKIPATPAVLFIVLVYLYRKNAALFSKEIFLSGVKIFGLLVAGFLICNFYLFFNSDGSISRTLSNGSYKFTTEGLLDHYKSILFRDTMAWDMIFADGINKAVLPIISIILSLLLLTNKGNRHLFVITLICYGFIILMFSFNRIWYPWHCFQSSIIPFLALAISRNEDKPHFSKLKIIILLVIIFANSAASLQNAFRDYKLRYLHSEVLSRWQENSDCIADFLNKKEPKPLIVNYSEVGGKLDYFENNLNDLRMVSETEWSYIAPRVEWVKKGFEEQSFKTPVTISVDEAKDYFFNKKQSELALIEGQRMLFNPAYLNYRQNLLDGLNNSKEAQDNKITFTQKKTETCATNNIWIISAEKGK